MALESVKDEAFSSHVLGQGAAVIPAEGRICAPVDAVVESVADAGHAIGLHTADGAGLLIHIGMDTVELGGKGFDVITYEETSATGFEGSVTTIRVEGSKNASIIRRGTANSVLSIEIGRKHYCQYETPYGAMQIGVYTHAIDNTIAKDGRLYMKYTLDLNSSYLSDNEIIMKVKSYN